MLSVRPMLLQLYLYCFYSLQEFVSILFVFVLILSLPRSCLQFVNFSLFAMFLMYLSDLLQNMFLRGWIVFEDILEVDYSELWRLDDLNFKFWRFKFFSS